MKEDDMVDLEQFREAVEFMQMRGTREQCIRAGDMLQAIIDNAKQGAMVPTLPGNWPEDANHENGDYECLCSQCGTTFYGHKRRVVCKACAKPAPVVDDARMARALEWVRTAARGNVGEGDALRAALIESARKHLHAIEEAIAAYDPNCGARTVRVVDDADATEILALSLDEFGYHTEARNVRAGEDLDEYRTEMWAIRAALSSAPGVGNG